MRPSSGLFRSQGDAVKALQLKLASQGVYRGRVTGKLDARTYRAWKGTGKRRPA
jgi:peptidoglycan hydrolase-like protein with peptidoglycan-binding domain